MKNGETVLNTAEVREKILHLREIPPMPVIAQKILCMSPDADVSELADTIESAPEIAARLLGMANSAYFGWPGGVRTIYDAIYKVLGIKLVKSFVLGLAFSEVFEVNRCAGFRPDRYWFSAMVTAQISQMLFNELDPSMRRDVDNIHMNGLLHNLGITVLAHLFPDMLAHAFSLPCDDRVRSVTDKIQQVFGVDHGMAGAWLGRKWHLPSDIVCVMEYHKETDYNGDFRTIVLLVGYAERQAVRLFATGEITSELEIETFFGLTEKTLKKIQAALDGRLEDLRSMAALMAGGD